MNLKHFSRVVLIGLSLTCVLAARARPRAPWPPLPDASPLLHCLNFDEPYWKGATNADLSALGFPDYVQSWSGYALRRTSESVSPFALSALDASGGIATPASVNFWFRPYWTSASLEKGTGPGETARLLEFVALGKDETTSFWSLGVAADGTVLYL